MCRKPAGSRVYFVSASVYRIAVVRLMDGCAATRLYCILCMIVVVWSFFEIFENIMPGVPRDWWWFVTLWRYITRWYPCDSVIPCVSVIPCPDDSVIPCYTVIVPIWLGEGMWPTFLYLYLWVDSQWPTKGLLASIFVKVWSTHSILRLPAAFYVFSTIVALRWA